MAEQRLDIKITGDDSRFGAAADRTVARLNRIGGAARSALGVLGVGIGASALKGVVDYGSRVSDLAQSLGISAENLQKMEYAAGQLGISMEGVSKSMTLLSKAAGEALGGEAGKQGMFARLGVSLEDLATLKPDELFLKISRNVQNTEGNAQQLADIMRLMGEQGGMVLGAMRDGFYDIATSAQAAANVINNEMISSLDRLSDASVRAKEGVRFGLGTIVGAAYQKFEEAIAYFAAATLPGTNEQRLLAFRQTLDQMQGRDTINDRTGTGAGAGNLSAIDAGGIGIPKPTSSERQITAASTAASDALAKIGLFRGGAGSSAVERRKVTLLEQIASNTSRTATVLSVD